MKASKFLLLLEISLVSILIAGVWLAGSFFLSGRDVPTFTTLDSTVTVKMIGTFEQAANKISPSIVQIFSKEERAIRTPISYFQR